MTEPEAPGLNLMAIFEQAAESARRTEDTYRRETAVRIEALARERANAFRRLNLVRTTTKALAEAEDPDNATARARFIVAGALGWDEIGPRQALVLDKLIPVFEAIQAEMSASEGPSCPRSQAALYAFEDWYRQETGTEFYALFERYMPETPRVDF
ncbi:hypothetical protein FG93_03725 [Bosea sp. LC85]|uniref:hypothetical protein n=1 Tax=Bosea sp. LC85 TaxID=1502851 RepID=UPI0004E428B3|nr:hypothetical protein [Bosea sp. LC85]KFC68462.1 hypothetical protein FG93_03725 [Bosea sp. LC85]